MRKVLLSVCLLICLVTLSFAAWNLYDHYRTYQDGKEEYDEMKDFISKNGPADSKDSKKDGDNRKGKKQCPITVDFDKLKKINPDVVGWIHIPDTAIDYPIVQAKDNKTYLHKTFKGKDSHIGAIFLDALCKPDFSSFNSIIYGHNLKNGEMFGHLKKLYDVEYNSKADYKKHPIVWIITPEAAEEYEIFAFREISARRDKDVFTTEIPDSRERRAFFKHQIRKSQKDTGISPSEDRRMITLSTCTSRTREGRFVVQAILR